MKFGIILVRHGETRYNKAKVLQGQGVDEPLSEFGFKQAKAAGQALSKVRFSHVFSSDLQRAKQTASAIVLGNSCGQKLEIICDARLRERKYGIVEGKPLSELRALAKAAGQKCPNFTPPGAETVDDVQARAKDFFNYLCQLLMTHTGKGNSVPDYVNTVAEHSGDLHRSLEGLHSVDSNTCDINDSNSDIAEDLIANILIVSHGGLMLQWVRHFVENLKCPLPPSIDQSKAFSVCPNAGISSFVITFDQVASSSPQIVCDYLYKCSHLDTIGVQQDVFSV
ncbi:fructose-2,6-bisphosphatase TIGAR-like isoform X2 [Carcharodon carcharias]|uniref:fructose-2,6-bisphosphatase TIGAR-like isoform X2 n=1 Tax=Carcharodon carcharias TaxID=13397 RepID=UPI001B7D9375|nr:fructose-2,6-bisphosphatase TIGAR-like isoform X2 [Carcharodon carcharias]